MSISYYTILKMCQCRCIWFW